MRVHKFAGIWYRQTDAKLNIAGSIQNKCRYMSSINVDMTDTHS